MNTLAVGYAIVATFFFLMIAKYDIHMFQLSSYRNRRYFRWLIPGNIISLKRAFAHIMFAAAFTPGYWAPGIAALITVTGYIHCFREKFKTPLVYTMRVKRLFATDILLFVAITASTMLFAGEWAKAITGATLLLSN